MLTLTPQTSTLIAFGYLVLIPLLTLTAEEFIKPKCCNKNQ